MAQQDRVALVTGATRGIGQAIALALAQQQNTFVVGTATTQIGADKITQAFADQKLQGTGLVLDVTSQDSINQTLAMIKQQYTMPAIVVNNAAITQDNLLLRMKEEEWDAVIQTNLTSLYKITKACLRDMLKAHWGRIINIGSVVGSIGNAGQANYAAAKAGLIGFTRALAQEVGRGALR